MAWGTLAQGLIGAPVREGTWSWQAAMEGLWAVGRGGSGVAICRKLDFSKGKGLERVLWQKSTGDQGRAPEGCVEWAEGAEATES